MNADGPRPSSPATAADSGLALKLPGAAALLPVSPAGCLAVARAVLAGMAADRERWAVAWELAGADPAVAAWISAEGIGGEPGAAVPVAAEAPLVVTRLRQALVASARGERTAAGLLLDALAAAESHHTLAVRFEERVAEARLESLRELAYGAGHEINNPLANIAARAQALLLDEREPERRRRLATIVDQAFRARDMIGGLMLFARPPKPELVETTAEDVIRPVLDGLAPRAAARGIRLEYSPAPVPVRLLVDATQVGEAVRMLAVNAVEAVDDGGRVHLESWADALGARGRIAIEDDGPGMSPEAAMRACDPFYSGREAGRGIGLGLPKARRLVESSGGGLALESRPGRGTRCVIDLPAAPHA
jgi:signal transduction histidine kinase